MKLDSLLTSQHELWKEQSSHWQHVGSPQRPTQEDMDILWELVSPRFVTPAADLQVIVLGVTPEVVQVPWPREAVLHAFDISADMIAQLWQPNPRLPCQVLQCSWQSLPLASASVDAVVGDGFVTALQGMIEARDVIQELSRILKPGAILVMRCFVRPPAKEPSDSIIADVMAGKVAHFGTLKWRLAMTLCDGEQSTARPREILALFNDFFPDRDQLAQITGWQRDTIDTIDAYRDVTSVYTFPTLMELENCCQPLFKVADVRYGHYELAERCPSIAFVRQD